MSPFFTLCTGSPDRVFSQTSIAAPLSLWFNPYSLKVTNQMFLICAIPAQQHSILQSLHYKPDIRLVGDLRINKKRKGEQEKLSIFSLCSTIWLLQTMQYQQAFLRSLMLFQLLSPQTPTGSCSTADYPVHPALAITLLWQVQASGSSLGSS